LGNCGQLKRGATFSLLLNQEIRVASGTDLANFGAGMLKVRPRDFGLRCASNFEVARPFNYAFIEAFVKSALKEFSANGIGPNNFSRSSGDGLFGYVVSFSLFNGNATFVLNRDGLVTTLSNGQTESDVHLIRDLLSKALKCLAPAEPASHVIMGVCNGEFQEPNGLRAVFEDLIKSTSSFIPVSLSVLEPTSQPPVGPVKLEIAQSEFREGHVFMAWHFTAHGSLTDEFWKALRPRLDQVARSVGIEVVL
jgi:hypothetical protein